MLNELSFEIHAFVETTKQNMPIMLILMGLLWVLNILNWLTGSHLNKLGILPRHPIGLIGIPIAPLLHSDFNHLFFNSIPLFALGLFVMADGLLVFIYATILITLLGGFSIWLIGRYGIDIGASAVIAGYFGFVLAKAYERPSITSLFLGSIALYYFGSILFSIIPTSERVSWEGHLLGLLSGVLTMIIFKNMLVV